MTSKTPPQVAATATQSGVLKNRARLTLIGVMGTTSTPHALLMTHAGRTLRVTLGDRTPNGPVVAIGDDSIILGSGRSTTTLTMPN